MPILYTTVCDAELILPAFGFPSLVILHESLIQKKNTDYLLCTGPRTVLETQGTQALVKCYCCTCYLSKDDISINRSSSIQYDKHYNV